MVFSVNDLRVAGVALAVGLLLAGSAVGQQPARNDGFWRRNGQMEVIRNGKPYAMTRDAHLPTGATVTHDGFVVSAAGQRTELREGQGCDLRGRLAAVRTGANGALALAGPGTTGRLGRVAAPAPWPEYADRDDDERHGPKPKKGRKHHGKGPGHHKHD